MHVETIHFDAVFDVVERSGNFSFKSGGLTEYGVRLRNRAIPRQGAAYAVAFAERGNWQSVMAWRDLASGDVVFAQSTMSLQFYMLSDLIMYGWLFITGAVLMAGGVAAALVTLAAPVAWRIYYLMRRNRELKDALLAARL
jgi:hypothetical protein